MATLSTTKTAFGTIDPDDARAFWIADRDFGRIDPHATRERRAFFERHALRDEAHWDEVRKALLMKWGMRDDGIAARIALANEDQRAQLDAATRKLAAPLPVALLEPVDGVGLEDYARIDATKDDPAAHARMLASHGLDEARFEKIRAEWSRRMDVGATDPKELQAAALLKTLSAMHAATSKSG